MNPLLMATRLMNRLRYRDKFALLACLVAASNLILVLMVAHILIPRYQTTAKELRALAFVGPVLQQIQLVQQHRGLTHGLLAGYGGAMQRLVDRRQQIDSQFSDLSRVVQNFSNEFQDGTESIAMLRTEWESLLAVQSTTTAAESMMQHTEYINRLLRYQLHIADTGRLFEDSNYEAHLLIEMVIEQLPNLLENMGLLRAKGTSILASGRIAEEDRADIIGHIHMLNHSLIKLRRLVNSLSSLKAENSATTERINVFYERLNSSANDMVSVISEDILLTRFTVSPEEYFNRTTIPIDHGFEQIFKTLIPAIQDNLQHRTHTTQIQLIITLGGSVLLFLVLGLFLAALYRSVITSIRDLSNAAEAVSRADFSVSVDVSTTDEMAQVASSFNAMVAALDLMIGNQQAVIENVENDSPMLPAPLEKLVQERTQDLKSALERAKSAEKAKDEFLANMSHEIRTPLNAIIGMAGLALRSGLNEKQRDYVEKMHDSGEHLLGVINDILDLSKITAGKMSLEVENFALPAQLSRVISVLGTRAAEKGLRLESNIADDVPVFVKGDMLRLNQILMNLVSNAVKFSTSGSIVINVSLLEQNDREVALGFSVTDSGIGMSADDMARLFQPFNQVDASITRKYGGTGLGLTICKHLVEMMNGEISVSSEKGQGSTFTFSVRLLAGEVPGSDTSMATGWLGFEPVWRFENAHILLADDQPMNRQITEELLTSVGVTSDSVEDGRQALERLMDMGPKYYDLVLMDIQMPEMDGLTATRRIRALPGFAELPIIAMTAHVMAEERKNCLDAGMNDHIGKPFRPVDLIRMIATWLPIEKKHHVGADPARENSGIAEGAPENSPPTVTRLYHLDEFDVSSALARFGGKTDKYLMWLNDFAAANTNAIQEVSALLAQGQLTDVSKRVHKIKGQAGTLGMGQLFSAASAFEQVLRAGNEAQDALDEFRLQMDRAIAIIKKNKEASS